MGALLRACAAIYQHVCEPTCLGAKRGKRRHATPPTQGETGDAALHRSNRRF